MDIHVGVVESEVRAVDGMAAMDPSTRQQLMRELLAHVAERDAHALRVRREQAVNAGRTAETVD